MVFYHVNVTGVHGGIDMNNLNYSLILAFIFGTILCLIRKQRQRCLKFILRWLVCIFVYIGILLEIYVIQKCPISMERHNAVKNVLKEHARVLKEMEVPFCASDGTVLHVLRNSSIAPWDQDSDLFIIKPNNTQEFFAEFKKRMGSKYGHLYVPERNLIQSTQGHGHGDIWMLELVGDEKVGLYDNHPGGSYFTHQKSMFFPPREISWTGFDKNPLSLYLPNKAEDYASSMFGENYMTPYYNRNQCLENFATKTSNFTYWSTWVSVAFVSCLFYILHEIREVQITILRLCGFNRKSKEEPVDGIQMPKGDECEKFLYP